MSESPSPSDTLLTPLLAAAVQVALVVAGWGFTSLLLNRDVIPDPGWGPLVAPLAVAASAVVTAGATRRALVAGRPVAPAIASAAIALLAMLAVVALGVTISTGDAAWLLLAPAAALAAPFVPLAALLSGVSVLGGWALGRAARHDRR